MNALIRSNNFALPTRAFFADPWLSQLLGESPAVADIRLDVEETKDAYLVRADLPGVAKDQVQVEIDEDVVRISVDYKRETTTDAKALRIERASGSATRAFRLPVAVDAAKADARQVDGVLLLTLPKLAPAAKRLTIN